MSDEYQKVKLQATHGPDTHFEGRMIGEYSTQNRARTKSRWTELRLWETPAGAWVTESVGRSDNDREFDIVEVSVIARAPMRFPGAPGAEPLVIGGMDDEEAVGRVMEAWGWTTAAKAFARERGWDVIRRVE